MSRIPSRTNVPVRLLAVSLGAGLFAFLVWRAGPRALWENVLTLGWRFTWVLALAGISHLVRTWAWRLTLTDDKRKTSFPRLVGLRLGAEAAGQLGIFGQTLGDSIRVSRLGEGIPIATSIASVTLDRGLYIVAGTAFTVAGILAALPALAFFRAMRLYAELFVLVLTIFLLSALVAVRKRWRVFSGSARFLGRHPSLKNWMESRYLLIQSVENTLLDFHHNTPNAFWASFALYLASHGMAVLEVCLILGLMGVKIGFLAALVIEALTKLVNVMGNLNPGNIGTYEGGNMLIGRIFGLSGATGLALGLARRLRSFFFAVVGVICLYFLTRPKKRRDSDKRGSAVATETKDPTVQADPTSCLPRSAESAVAIFLAKEENNSNPSTSPLAPVGSLPILLRTILAARKAGLTRIMIFVDPVTRLRVQNGLSRTRRLPKSVEWVETSDGRCVWQQLRVATSRAESTRLVLIDGNTTFHPSLLRDASEWNDPDAALVLTSGSNPVGIYALPLQTIRHLAEHCLAPVETLEKLDESLTTMSLVVSKPVPENLWHRVRTPQDCQSAERKLDRWLVKPTDGIYARMNRRISIPISRQLIKFPVTPNMVSIFTLGVGLASAACFAHGGYWNTLLGAFLCLFASILDGCDGEVARLKLMESDFGCWLETVCDYLFYLSLFVGMTIGLWRSSGKMAYLVCGGLLLMGSIASFLATGWERHRLAAGRPEQLLTIWQTHAESRPSNPFLYFGRHAEFIVRRCFFPYALLLFALFNIVNAAFVLSAIGANLVWPIALYSSRTFAGTRNSTVVGPAASA